MAGHWSKVGRNQGDAVGAYNSAVASLENRVLVSTRRFNELKAVPDGAFVDQKGEGMDVYGRGAHCERRTSR